MSAHSALGRQGEELAAGFLRRAGLEILARNWRCALGELDIIACEGRTLVAVEVKTRTGHAGVSPLEALTAGKIRRMRLLIRSWRARTPRRFGDMRLDAVCLLYTREGGWLLRHLRGVQE